jgi:phosphatidylglycerophosphate synthase
VHAVLFNAPNSVGWLRLLLMLAGIQQAAEGQASNAFWLFVISISLDAVDGWLARRLGQVGAAVETRPCGFVG